MQFADPSQEFIDAFNINEISAVDSSLMKPEYIKWVYRACMSVNEEYIAGKFNERCYKHLLIRHLPKRVNRMYIDTYDIIRHLDDYYRYTTEDFEC